MSEERELLKRLVAWDDFPFRHDPVDQAERMRALFAVIDDARALLATAPDCCPTCSAVKWLEDQPTVQGDLRPHGYMPKRECGLKAWLWCFRDWRNKKDSFAGWSEGLTLLEAVSNLKTSLAEEGEKA